MITLLKDDDLRANIGEQGRLTICENYSWEAIAERHLDFYQRYL